jgi:hypothetical protein
MGDAAGSTGRDDATGWGKRAQTGRSGGSRNGAGGKAWGPFRQVLREARGAARGGPPGKLGGRRASGSGSATVPPEGRALRFVRAPWVGRARSAVRRGSSEVPRAPESAARCVPKPLGPMALRGFGRFPCGALGRRRQGAGESKAAKRAAFEPRDTPYFGVPQPFNAKCWGVRGSSRGRNPTSAGPRVSRGHLPALRRAALRPSALQLRERRGPDQAPPSGSRRRRRSRLGSKRLRRSRSAWDRALPPRERAAAPTLGGRRPASWKGSRVGRRPQGTGTAARPKSLMTASGRQPVEAR